MCHVAPQIRGPLMGSISITWKFVRNANTLSPSSKLLNKDSLVGPLGNSYAY